MTITLSRRTALAGLGLLCSTTALAACSGGVIQHGQQARFGQQLAQLFAHGVLLRFGSKQRGAAVEGKQGFGLRGVLRFQVA